MGRDEKRAPLKTPAWEARQELALHHTNVCSRRVNSTTLGRDRPWSTLALIGSPCKFGLVQYVRFVASPFVPPYFLRIFLFGHCTHPILFPLKQGLNLVWPKRSLLEHGVLYRWCPPGRWCCRCPPSSDRVSRPQ